MMRLKSLLIMAGSLVLPATVVWADSPTTAPSNLEVRAMEEFNRGQYALALPMLQQVVTEDKASQPDKATALEENIRVCQRNLAVQAQAPAPAIAATPDATPDAATVGGSLSAGRVPHPAPVPGQVQEMAIKDLGNFDYDADKGGDIPPDVTALSGSKIRLSGYMIPMDQAESITEFALVPSLFSCCFGQPPQIQHTIVVHVPKGKAVSYYPDEISVEGKLHVEEKKEDGFIVSIFEVDTSSVKPAPK
jgi:hypothetical protein